jgi:hypothetical protein
MCELWKTKRESEALKTDAVKVVLSQKQCMQFRASPNQDEARCNIPRIPQDLPTDVDIGLAALLNRAIVDVVH